MLAGQPDETSEEERGVGEEHEGERDLPCHKPTPQTRLQTATGGTASAGNERVAQIGTEKQPSRNETARERGDQRYDARKHEYLPVDGETLDPWQICRDEAKERALSPNLEEQA